MWQMLLQSLRSSSIRQGPSAKPIHYLGKQYVTFGALSTRDCLRTRGIFPVKHLISEFACKLTCTARRVCESVGDILEEDQGNR